MKNKVKVIFAIIASFVITFGIVVVLKNFDADFEMPIFKKEVVITVDATPDVIRRINELQYDRQMIQEVRNAYDNLNNSQKERVSNYDHLVEYETNIVYIETVETAITNIDGSEESIVYAKTVYTDLQDDLKPYVSNYNDLLEAEQEFIRNDPEIPVIDDPQPTDPTDDPDDDPTDDPQPVEPQPTDPTDDDKKDDEDKKDDDPTPVTPVEPTNIKVGDSVYFTGGYVYRSSYEKYPSSIRGKILCKVTIIEEGSAHPYHLVSPTNETLVYGWCDANNVERAGN